MDWMAFLIAAGGLGLGLAGIVLTYRDRTSAYRERVYDKQLEACLDLSRAVSAVYRTLLSAELNEAVRLVKKAPRPATLWREYVEATETLRKAERAWEVMIPASVQDALRVFNAACSDVRGWELGEPSLDRESDFSSEKAKAADSAYRAFIVATRGAVGVDKLGADTLALIGREDTPLKPPKNSPPPASA